MNTDRLPAPTPASERVTTIVALAVMTALGLCAVLVLPSLASQQSQESRAGQSTLTALAVLSLTASYIWFVYRFTGWHRASAVLTFAYLAGIATVKFVISPGAFFNSNGVSLAEYLWLGFGVMLLYIVGLSAIYWVSSRYRDRTWPWLSKVVVVACLLAFAAGSRYVAAHILAEDVSDYLGDALRGGGIWLFAVLAGSLVAAIEAFDGVGRERAFRVGMSVVVVYHGLWAVYMFRLFD